jgi:MoxR-like ATPase
MNTELKTAEKNVQDIIDSLNKFKQEIHKTIVGQEEIIDQLLITFLAGGHGLLEGVPGLAKTLMIRSLIRSH